MMYMVLCIVDTSALCSEGAGSDLVRRPAIQTEVLCTLQVHLRIATESTC
jgi:hypothetical protein